MITERLPGGSRNFFKIIGCRYNPTFWEAGKMYHCGIFTSLTYSRLLCYPQGLSKDTPLICISFIFPVTTVRSYLIPVAAISPSITGMLLP